MPNESYFTEHKLVVRKVCCVRLGVEYLGVDERQIIIFVFEQSNSGPEQFARHPSTPCITPMSSTPPLRVVTVYMK